MPAVEIRVDYEALEHIAKRFQQEADNLRQTLRATQQSFNRLENGDWLGKGAHEFCNEMHSLVLPSMQRLIEAIEEAHSVTLQIRQIMQEAELEAASPFIRRGGTNGINRVLSQGGNFALTDLFSNLPEVPGWAKFLFDTGISFIPVVGDGLDLLRQGWNWVRGNEVDSPVVVLSALGLVADLGWLDGPVPDPVDGANLGLAAVKAALKAIPEGPARDAAVEILTQAAKNPTEIRRLLEVMGAVGKNESVLKALANYPQGLHLVLRNGPEAIEFLAKNGDGTGTAFANGQRFAEHFFKHADEFNHTTPQVYLNAARTLTNGGNGVETFVRTNGDKLFYRAETNEFSVMSQDGVIRTYFKPEDGRAYWLDQIGQ